MQLFLMIRGKILQHLLAQLGQFQGDLPPILRKMLAHDEFLQNQPIHQPHRAVMAHLQTLGQFANRDAAPMESLDSQ